MSDEKDINKKEKINPNCEFQNISEQDGFATEVKEVTYSKPKATINNKLLTNDEMEKFIKDILSMFDCKELFIIVANKLYGNFGARCYIEDDGTLKFYYKEKLKKIYKKAYTIFNNSTITQSNRLYITKSYRHKCNTLVLLEGAHTSKYCDYLYVLVNGQLYDAHNLYWFNTCDSRNLKKLLKEGYSYSTPESYFNN